MPFIQLFFPQSIAYPIDVLKSFKHGSTVCYERIWIWVKRYLQELEQLHVEVESLFNNVSKDAFKGNIHDAIAKWPTSIMKTDTAGGSVYSIQSGLKPTAV